MIRLRYIALLFSILISCWGCKNKEISEKLLALTNPDETGLVFENTIVQSDKLNIFNYRNFYNGGGVGIGDFNNDSLPDIYMTSNQGSNKLFLNEGDFKFSDVTDKAGVAQADKWSTGVSVVDINNDGYLDIYVSNAGYRKDVDQRNTLYINNGDMTFTDQAKSYGLDDNGYTTQTAFFDYDKDGDLDAYILNNSFIPVNTLNYSNQRELRAADWDVRDFLKGGGDKLMRNDEGVFTDVSEEANIYGSLIGFGLGITVSDFNNDQYPDLYICNDFFERDYLYYNNTDGTFSEVLVEKMDHISHSSMGADVADINNDGIQDLFVTDMLPDDDYRLKTTSSFDDINQRRLKEKSGFYYQYMHNTLQLGSTDGSFTEISNYAGVDASDWSWGALLFDIDNDSNTDLYVSNGINHDVIDQDFIDFFANEITQKMALSGKKSEISKVMEAMPSVPIQNKIFRNNGNLTFEDYSTDWAQEHHTFSNGSAYADLDLDGDLDLIVNNVNQPADLYQNNSVNSSIAITLEGPSDNKFGLGSKVEVWTNDTKQIKELYPTRGFQSSVDYRLLFGLGVDGIAEKVVVTWPDGKKTELSHVDNGHHVLKYDQAKDSATTGTPDRPRLITKIRELDSHVEDDHLDYYYEKGTAFMQSKEGPTMDVGDVNGDGLDDVVVGGGAGQSTQVYMQNKSGILKTIKQSNLSNDARHEDTAIKLFDIDGDGDLDLVVGSGGNNYPSNHQMLSDRCYLNNGKGLFSKVPNALPVNGLNTSKIVPFDFDGDGLKDMITFSRGVPQNYGLAPIHFFYKNKGDGTFSSLTDQKFQNILQCGMVTDALLSDVNGDGNQEIVIVGEWMQPMIFSYSDMTFTNLDTELEGYFGLWRSVASGDIDGDGDIDLLLGNFGKNNNLDASSDSPLKLHINDFDNNRAIDRIMTRTKDGKDVPIFTKKMMVDQLPSLRKKITYHKDYAGKSMSDLFSEDILNRSKVLEANFFYSIVATNDGTGKFSIDTFPVESQLSCIEAIELLDVDGDGDLDILDGGNQFGMLPQFGTLDANEGEVLTNDGNGKFIYDDELSSGYNLKGAVRDISSLKTGQGQIILTTVNGKPTLIHQINSK